jgi:hypothetical protein
MLTPRATVRGKVDFSVGLSPELIRPPTQAESIRVIRENIPILPVGSVDADSIAAVIIDRTTTANKEMARHIK